MKCIAIVIGLHEQAKQWSGRARGDRSFRRSDAIRELGHVKRFATPA